MYLARFFDVTHKRNNLKIKSNAMKYFTSLLPAIIAGLSLASCTKEVSKAEKDEAILEIKMNNTERSGSFYAVRGPVTGGHAASGIVTWNDGYVNATSVSVKSANQPNEYSSKATFVTSAFQPASIATIPVEGSLQNAAFALQLQPVNGLAAIKLTGTYTDNSANTYPVTFQLDELLELRASTSSAIDGMNKRSQAVTTIRFGTMLETIPETLMTQAVLQANGNPVMISSTSNVDLYNYIKNILPGMLLIKFGDGE
jgi:hypothetical protein